MVSVKTEIHDGIGILKVSDPPNHFMTADMVKKMSGVFKQWSKEDTIKAIIVTNPNPGYFITHYSLAEIANGGRIINAYPFLNKPAFARMVWKCMRMINFVNRIPRIGKALLKYLERIELGRGILAINSMHTLYNAVQQMPKPVIAAIGGNCLGGGLEFALSCDFRIMVRGPYQMGLIEILIGTIPGGGGTQRLLRMIGEAKTKEIMLTGKRFSADEAMHLGIVTKAVEERDLERETMALAQHISNLSPHALAYAKKAIVKGHHLPLRKAIKHDVLGFLTTIGDNLSMQLCDDYEHNIQKGGHVNQLYDEMEKHSKSAQSF